MSRTAILSASGSARREMRTHPTGIGFFRDASFCDCEHGQHARYIGGIERMSVQIEEQFYRDECGAPIAVDEWTQSAPE